MRNDNEHGGLLDLHLRYLRSRGLSPLTVTGRRDVVRRLSRYLDAPAMGAGVAQIQAYLEFRAKAVSINTLRNDIAHLRAFFCWLRRHEYRGDDPMARIDGPRLVRPHVPPADDDALALALAAADVDDRAILVLSAFAGLRAAEVARLDWSDVDTRRERITVHGKGAKVRVISTSPPVVAALAALPHRHGPVIRRRDGRPGPNQPCQISKRASRLLGGRADGFTLHQLRHRFATVAYAGTLDLRAVQEALGHSSPTTTAIYAHTRTDAMTAAVHAAATLHTREAS